MPYGAPIDFGQSRVTLLSSDHILGSAQVYVETQAGARLGYSGDFQWPLVDVPRCDALVLDSTHGNPRYKRRYKQQEVEERLLELLLTKTKEGFILLRGHSGCLQRAVTLMAGSCSLPLLASDYTIAEFAVYAKYGFPKWPMVSTRSTVARSVLASGRGICLLRINEKPPSLSAAPIKIMLSEYISDPNDPVLEFSDRDFRVAISDHADFEGLVAYASTTGAKLVITDNTRGGHAVELANELRRRIGIDARPSGFEVSREWGRR
jgi:putative mRNA 3-end processing factor